jgi:hypothetical protein
MTASMRTGSNEDCGVGTFRIGDGLQFLPISQVELERHHNFVSRILSTFHFRTGGHFLVVSLYDFFSQFMPIERAAMDAGFIVCNADDSSFDAGRVESIIRRFDVKAIAAVSNNCLDGLQGLGLNLNQVFGDAVVWAYPDCFPRLADSQAQLRKIATLGPAIGMECAAGQGLHIDHFEWEVESINGEIHLTSKMPRAIDFIQFATGKRGRVEEGICTCGNVDKRILLDS